MSGPGRIYQFKIVLQDTSNPVWRRILVPEEYTFWDLHVAIQDAMGWQDCHPHEFRIEHPEKGLGTMGIPSVHGEKQMYPAWEQRLSGWFYPGRRRALYIYMFGEGWTHDLTLEETLERESGAEYPRCTEGAGCVPPEDCGGPAREVELDGRPDQRPPHYVSLDPGLFDPAAVKFTDPGKRLKRLLGD
jgi:hypothetical protein